MKRFKQRISFLVLIALLTCCLSGCLDDEDDYAEANVNTTNHEEAQGNSYANAISQDNIDAKNILLEKGLIRAEQGTIKGNGEDTVTILIYMNGSDLESDDGEATTDLSEMVAAGSSDKVKILVQTMGTKSWDKKFGIASDRSQIYSVDGDGLTLVKDDLGQLDCTKTETLTNFIKWGASNYPSDRYILLFWNHGGGPIYGFGYDQWNNDEYACLSTDEIQTALNDAGVYFNFIGMDCCIMSCLEVCCALYDYCDYTVLSEDFESWLGWSYTGWLKALYQNTSIPTVELATKICDDMVIANEQDPNGDSSIMAIIDEAMMKVLYTAWTDFAYENESSLLETNYSERLSRKNGGRILPSLIQANEKKAANRAENVSMSDYYVTDIMAVAQNIDSDKSAALSAAISQSLVYVRASTEDAALTGLSVTLPYGDTDFFSSLESIFRNIGIDDTYISWLEQFAYVDGYIDTYDYSDWNEDWNGWDDYDEYYDWDDWEYYDDDSYWDDFDDNSCGWDCFNYDDSYNYWADEYDWNDWNEYDWDEYYEYDDYYDSDWDDYGWDEPGYDFYYDDYDWENEYYYYYYQNIQKSTSQ